MKKYIEIPENATNGDMIKAMFPYGKYGTNGKEVHVYGVGGNGCLVFTLEWWNAQFDDTIIVPDDATNGEVLKCLLNANKLHEAIKTLEQDVISKQEVEEFVEYIQTIKDKHNDEGFPINYGTICDLAIRGWKLLERER